MAVGKESYGLINEGKEFLRTTVWTTNPSKAKLRVAAVKKLFDGLLEDRTKIAILSLKAVLILGDKLVKVMEEQPLDKENIG